MPLKYQGPLQKFFDDRGVLTYEAMQQLYQQGLSAMRIVDRDFTLVTQNPAMDRMVQLPAHLVAGKKCFEVARSREYCHTDKCPHSQIMAGKAQVEQVYECELWNGKRFPAWVLATPFYDDQNKLAGSLQIVRDETHLMAISQALEVKNNDLERHLRLARGQNEIIKILNRETRIENLADQTLRLLPRYTAVVTGVVYLFNDKDDRLVPIAQHALAGPPPEFTLGQGLPGEVALREEPVFMTNLPDTYLKFSSGTGEACPAHIACLPIQVGDRFIGVLELAAFSPLTEERQFLEDLTRQLGIAMQNSLMHKQTENLAIELQANNEKLAAQNEELKAQSEELIAQSEEIQSQTEELIAQRDALERKTIEADEANRMKSVFLSNMSHELRTPLNAILGLTRLMKDGVAGQLTDQQAQYLEVVMRNGGNLLELINDILDLARVETGREEMRFDLIQLRGFLEALAVSIKSLAERQGLTFKLDIAQEVTTLVSDERKLGQILTNLLGNAIKFTEKGSISLTVMTRETEFREFINFIVQDTGVGISPDHLDVIFEPFRQIDDSTSKKATGSGLGLSICQKLVILLGGEISVQSEKGVGTTFTVAIPRDRRSKNRLPDNEWQERFRRMFLPGLTEVREKQQIASPPPITTQKSILPADQEENQTGRPHILLVEDDMIAIRELGVLLREAGYRISFSLDGITGLELLDRHRPDLVVLDLKMQIMNGLEFLQEMRRNQERLHTPVLILSAVDLSPEETRSLPPNVKGVLPKGNIRKDQLLEQIRLILNIQPPALLQEPPGPDKTGQRSENQPTGLAKGLPQPGGRRILVAEDNPDNLFLIGEILKSSNYEIIKASNGREAIETASHKPPDLILMDIQMPDMGGVEAITAIRAHANLRNIPIVAITAKAMKGDRELILATGCDDYIAKPVEPTILLAVLKKWLGKGEDYG